MMIKDFAVLLAGADLPATNSVASDWIALFHPIAINGDRLFHKDIFSLADCFFEMNWTESGRRRQNGDVRKRNRLLVGIESDELSVFGHIEFFVVINGLLNLIQAPIETIS